MQPPVDHNIPGSEPSLILYPTAIGIVSADACKALLKEAVTWWGRQEEAVTFLHCSELDSVSGYSFHQRETCSKGLINPGSLPVGTAGGRGNPR